MKLLLAGDDRLDKLKMPKRKDDASATEAIEMVADILASPVLKRVLCNSTNFSFNPNSVILARINRAELGEFDALVLWLFLMAHFKGQVVVPDLGFLRPRDAYELDT